MDDKKLLRFVEEQKRCRDWFYNLRIDAIKNSCKIIYSKKGKDYPLPKDFQKANIIKIK